MTRERKVTTETGLNAAGYRRETKRPVAAGVDRGAKAGRVNSPLLAKRRLEQDGDNGGTDAEEHGQEYDVDER